MKKLYVIILFLLPLSSLAQESISYSTVRENIRFAISHDEYYLEFSGEDWQQTLQNIAATQIVALGANAAKITLSLPGANFETRKTLLANLLREQFKRIEPVLVYEDSTRQICTGQIIIKPADTTRIEALFSQYDITIQPDEFVSRQYLVNFNTLTTQQVFALLTQLKDNRSIEFAEPNFIRFIKLNTNDPFYSSQWAIKNQGYLGGTSGADMHVEDAWNYATGQGIKVAVIDEGVDLNHVDLAANLLTGYDATGNNSAGAPNSTNNDAHGTACAGIIAAVANNNIGVAGLAYNAKVIPVRIAYSNGYPLGSQYRAWISNDSWIANGIAWAKNNGADILSNSWGGGSSSSTITNAINDAVNNGRGGKGCVVLFSTGNNNSTSIGYPSTLSNVIAVGASSMCDERKSFTSCDGETWWGGNYGTGLDVMAPGVKIYTTDISGSAGYNTGDYRSDFNGTSSACPNAAGVMALILSVNPNLTAQQARDILETTCEKVGGYTYQSNVSGQPNGTWSSDAGYGRVNACAAVSSAIASALSISGPNSVCTTSDPYTISNLPTSATVTWSATPSFVVTVNTPNATQTTLTKNGTSSYRVTLTATISVCGQSVAISKYNIAAGDPNEYSLYAHYSTQGYSDWLGDINCLKTYTFPGMYSGDVQVYDSAASSFNWSFVSKYPSTATVGIGPDPSGHNVTVTVKPQHAWVIYRLTTTNECGSYSHDYKFVADGVCVTLDDFAGPEEELKVSPNPTNNSITLQLDAKSKQAIEEIIIRNKMNKPVKQLKIKSGSKIYRMDITDLPADMYIVQVFDGNKWLTRKIIKQ